MASVSSLLKSGASVRNQLATYQDSVQAYEYSNSAYTDSALNDYINYLQSRVNALNAAPSVTNASKALSLTKAMDSATKSNISATIQRENIQMMAGNASLTDKYTTIVDQYSRAYANGDMTLAQSLMSQAYSVNQSIQLQAQQAITAQNALAAAAEAAGKAAAGEEVTIADSLTSNLKQLNNNIKATGMGNFNSTVKAWVDQNSAVLQSLGVKLPNQPNYWDIVTGVAGAQYNHYMLASQMYAPYGTGYGSDSWKYALSASDVNSGLTKLPTLAGDLSLQTVMAAAANPSQYIYNPSKGAFVQTQQTGNKFQTTGPNGTGPLQIQPTYSGTVEHTQVLSPTQTALMQKFGLNFSMNKPAAGAATGNTGDGVQIQATNKTPVWLQQILGHTGVTNMYTTPQYDANGNKTDALQFTYDAKNGEGLSVYTIVSDAQGHYGVIESSTTGDHVLAGEYGFNPSNINPTKQAGQSVMGRFGANASSFLMGHASADGILGAGTNNFSLPPPIPIAQAPALPSISLPQPSPLPTINTQAAPTPSTQAVVPHTVSVQPAAGNIQGSSTQGINNAPARGVAITGVTNTPVGMRL